MKLKMLRGAFVGLMVTVGWQCGGNYNSFYETTEVSNEIYSVKSEKNSLDVLAP